MSTVRQPQTRTAARELPTDPRWTELYERSASCPQHPDEGIEQPE